MLKIGDPPLYQPTRQHEHSIINIQTASSSSLLEEYSLGNYPSASGGVCFCHVNLMADLCRHWMMCDLMQASHLVRRTCVNVDPYVWLKAVHNLLQQEWLWLTERVLTRVLLIG